jgi:hypothetical protein
VDFSSHSVICAGGQGQRAFDNLLFGGFERESFDFEKECNRQEAGARDLI